MSVFIVYVLVIILVITSIHKKNQAEKNRRHRGGNAVSRDLSSSSRNLQKHPQVLVQNNSMNVGQRVRSEKPLQKNWYEDRNNDWLANQMREERAALYRLQDMFSFRMQGRNITDAELLKEFHVEHCDADRVDRAAGK